MIPRQKLSLKTIQSSRGSITRKLKQTPQQINKQFFEEQLLKSEMKRDNSKLRRSLITKQRVRITKI